MPLTGWGECSAGIEDDIGTCSPLVAAIVIVLGSASGSDTNAIDVSNDAGGRKPKGIERESCLVTYRGVRGQM